MSSSSPPRSNISYGKRDPLSSKSTPSASANIPSERFPSNEGKRSKTTSGRKQSHSPPRQMVARSKTSPSKGRSGRSKNRTRDVSATDDKRNEVVKEPELTKSGLKITDLSGQGMTSIPFTIMTAKDVGHLILTSNNLRSIPTDIVRMTHLEKLDISKNGIRCIHSNDYTGLPEEMAQLMNLTELNLSECNLPFIPPVIFKMSKLKVLDISRNKISILLPEIGQLVNLVRLNLQQINITSLPPEIAYCQELEEIYLWGNSIETLPETLSEMPKLTVVALNYKNFCGVVDPYMENLLKKGQIKSEHIPIVVFELPALEVLDLENTKLNTLPDVYNKMLKEFYLCKNFLQTIPPSIYNLKHLQVLDMSNNLLNSLPEDIGHLNGLKVLRLSTNSIKTLPSSIGNLIQLEEFNISQNRIQRLPPEIKGLTSLQVLILARNKIQTLPDEICELTQLRTLDLTSNEIRYLPMAMYHLTKLTVAHSFHKLDKCGLWLYKNPLEEPPPEVWRSEKSNNIFEYLKKAVTFNIENLQRQKVLLFGESQCGKTSLVSALTLRKSLWANGLQVKTRLLHQTIWKTDNKVEFVLNDFGGDNAYRILYRMFLDNKALVMVVYNAATLCEENFYSYIGQWLDMLSVSIPGAIVKIVGTHSDLLNSNTDTDKKKSMLVSDVELKPAENSTDPTENEGDISVTDSQPTIIRDVGDHTSSVTANKEIIHDLLQKYLSSKDTKIRDELKSLEHDINKVEKSGHAKMNVNEAALTMMRVREKKLENILQNPLKILPEISFTSASNSLEEILKLTDELEHLAIDKTLFPHAQRHIPSHWKRLMLKLKQRKGYYLYWDDVEHIAERFNIKDEELREFIKHLHDTADVIWFKEDPALCQIVFHKPKMLVNIITSLYRHDTTDFLNYDNKAFLCKGRMNSQQFQECAEIFTHTGQISRPLLNCFWFPFNFNDDDIAQLLELLPLLEICYSVPEPDVPTGLLYNRPLMVLPWYNKDTNMTSLKEVWSATKEDTVKELAAVYTFPFFYPPEILPSLSVQIQDFVDERLDYKEIIYASSGAQKMLLHHTAKGDNDLLTVLIRGSEFSKVQTFMEELVNLLNIQLLRYPGLYWRFTIPMGVGNLNNVFDSSH